MLKHGNIIEKLTVKQKIALLTDIGCLADPEFVKLGIPYTSIRTFKDILTGTGERISAHTLARTWNSTTVGELTEELVSCAEKEGTNFVIAPSPKIRFSPYESSMSEDPYLSGVLTGAYLNAVHRAGIPACISGFNLNEEDVKYMDTELSQRVLYEYFIYPFKLAAKLGDCHSVMGSVTGPSEEYGDLNLKLTLSAESGLFHVNMNVLCDEHTPEATAEVWHAGGIVMQGVSTVLELAHEKYQHIVQAIQEGHATVNDLEEAYADGSAISDDMMDAAVERVIDFAFACRSERTHEQKEDVSSTFEEDTEQPLGYDSVEPDSDPYREMLEQYGAQEDLTYTESTSYEVEEEQNKPYVSDNMLKAVKESIVLLKNDTNILPIKTGYRVAMIGDIAMNGDNESFAEQVMQGLSNPHVGSARGYALNEDKSDELIGEATELASRADVVLLFLGIDEKRLGKLSLTRQLELPANQAALLDAMTLYMHKTVVILSGDVLPAARFDGAVRSLVLAPIGGLNCAHALSEVLSGAYNPSGRLTESYYDDPVERFDTLKRYKDIKRNKIGPFIGYRHYDSSDLKVRYPFGHGKSYTTFSYSHLQVIGNTVEFFLENSGSVAGVEVIQIYIGKSDSRYIRPKKELKAFAKIALDPLEIKKISIKLTDPTVYDEENKRFVVEGGTYEIYVGASVADIRLRGQMTVAGEELEDRNAEKEKRSDYLQSDSNILSDKYTLEAEYRKMKRSWKWKFCYIACLVIAVLLNSIVFSLAAQYGEVFDAFGEAIYGAVTFIDVCIFLFTAFFIVMDVVTSRRIRKAKAHEDRERAQENFEDAVSVENLSADELFVKEFDEVIANAKAIKARKGFDLSDFSQFVDHEMTFSGICRELSAFTAHHGIKLPDDAPASILSSFATARLLMLSSLNGSKLQRFIHTLSAFFACPVLYEEINESFADGSLLYVKDENGEMRESAVLKMINSAKEHKETVHFVTLTNVTANDMSTLFSQYIRYFNNPERECKISVKGIDDKIVLPENIWFVVSLAEGEKVQNLPIYMTELMSVIGTDYVECEESFEEIEHHALGYYQINYLAERCKNGFEMPEDLWKKVDSLEEYVYKHTSYHFGNKLWLRLEKYLAVFSACEYEAVVALDNALNASLISVIQAVLEGKLADDDRGLLEAIELYFGEENVPCCRKTLKNIVVTEE